MHQYLWEAKTLSLFPNIPYYLSLIRGAGSSFPSSPPGAGEEPWAHLRQCQYPRYARYLSCKCYPPSCCLCCCCSFFCEPQTWEQLSTRLSVSKVGTQWYICSCLTLLSCSMSRKCAVSNRALLNVLAVTKHTWGGNVTTAPRGQGGDCVVQ